MSAKKRVIYDSEFKKSAVKLVLENGQSVRSTARDLGINEQTLHKWKKAYENKPENAEDMKMSAEIRRLNKELEKARMERDVLKKALAFFSKESE